ncbi:glycosyltransferase [Candidatus Peregrinibacteria bacterium]|nr:glycosyltransferase [Candidatus Peregrinibacteria bacterium]
MKPKVSVVIPVLNEEKNIGDCLDALSRQTYAPFEVILVDNRSTDHTVETAKKHAGKLALRVIREEQPGRGAARRRGFSEARGEVIFSTDADAVVPEDWISTILHVLEQDTKTVACCSGSRILDCSPRVNATYNIFHPVFMRTYRIVMGHYLLCGFSFAVRKEAYDNSGGFSAVIDGQEDVDLSRRINKMGRICYIPDCPVIFSGRRFRKGVARGCFDYILAYVNVMVLGKKTYKLSNVR